MAVIFKNIVTDFGAISGGNNDVAFAACSAWAIANQGSDQFDLTFPAGTYDTPGSISFATGVKDLVVHGTGATVTVSTGSNALFLGGVLLASTSDETGTSYFNTRSAGAVDVTLSTASEASRYSPGDWVLLLGVDVMKAGWPPNDVVFEYQQVITSNAGTGVVTFTAALQFSYEQTWPFYGDKNQGGPATMIKLDSTWNVSVDYRGITFGSGANATPFYCGARVAKFTDVLFASAAGGGYAPGGCQAITLTNVTQTAQMELDKLTDVLTIQGGTFSQILVQSSCGANRLIIDGTTLDLNGTPKTANIQNAVIGTLAIGGLNFGPTTDVRITNSSITNWTLAGAIIDNADTDFTMAGGVITVNKVAEAYGTPWAAPGVRCMFIRNAGGGDYYSEYPFTVTNVTDDATNVYVRTTLSGGFPGVPTDGTRGLTIWNHPCPRFTGINLTGSRTSIDLSQPPAQGRPIGSYTKRTYDTATLLPLYTGQAPTTVPVFGKISTIKINVRRAYTGIHGPLLMNVMGPFGTVTIDPSNAQILYNPVVNLSVSGLRDLFNPATALSSDVFSTPLGLWLAQGYWPTVSADISAEASSVWPIVEIEVITDQGIDVIDSAPLYVARAIAADFPMIGGVR